MLAISQIYEKVICCVRIGKGISSFFKYNTIGVKQGCPLSPIRFGLCIYELEQMVAKFYKGDIEEVIIRNVIIMLLLYAHEMISFANTLGDA